MTAAAGPGGCLGDVACTIRQPITEAPLRSGELVITNRQSCAQVTLDLHLPALTAGRP